MVRYFLVKEPNGYEIWGLTAEEMYQRMVSDRTLGARLDHHPFNTFADAQIRRKALIEAQAKASPNPEARSDDHGDGH